MVDNTTPTTSDLIFEDPTPPALAGRPSGTSPLGAWLKVIRNYPGQWVKFPLTVASSRPGTAIRSGKGYGATPGEFEVATRSAADGTKRVYLYARYIGGGES